MDCYWDYHYWESLLSHWHDCLSYGHCRCTHTHNAINFIEISPFPPCLTTLFALIQIILICFLAGYAQGRSHIFCFGGTSNDMGRLL